MSRVSRTAGYLAKRGDKPSPEGDRSRADGVVAMLFMAVMLAHIYIGTIGMEGAFEAMGSGAVDVNWAKEHHSLWLEEENARTGTNETRSQPSITPAE